MKIQGGEAVDAGGWIEDAIDAEEAFRLTADLVRIRSYPGEEAAVQRAVADWLAANGMPAELPEAAPERPNVVLRLENGPRPAQTLLLNGHTDTVLADPAWEHDPWEGRREGDRFFGLGAGDMKCGMAALMLATRALDRHREAWSGTVIFTSVVDEEAYSIGAHALIDSGVAAGADSCVVMESAWERPCLGAQGKLLVRVDVRGRAAHASFAHEGVNAAVEAARLVARLDELEDSFPTHPHIRASQAVLSSLSGGGPYVITIPEQAVVLINRHTVPGETEVSVLARYRELAESLGSAATFDFSVDPPFYPPWETDPAAPVAVAFADAYRAETGHDPAYGYWGFGDPNLFSTTAGIPTVMFGAHAGRYHQAGEWVDIPSIAAAARTLLRMTVVVLAPDDGGPGGEKPEP